MQLREADLWTRELKLQQRESMVTKKERQMLVQYEQMEKNLIASYTDMERRLIASYSSK